METYCPKFGFPGSRIVLMIWELVLRYLNVTSLNIKICLLSNRMPKTINRYLELTCFKQVSSKYLFIVTIQSHLVQCQVTSCISAKLVGAVKYTDCNFVEALLMNGLDMRLNHLMVRLQSWRVWITPLLPSLHVHSISTC